MKFSLFILFAFMVQNAAAQLQVQSQAIKDVVPQHRIYLLKPHRPLLTSFQGGTLMLPNNAMAVRERVGIKVPRYNHPSFFCKVEAQLEKKSVISPRFRLGSLDYVNRLEGKGNW